MRQNLTGEVLEICQTSTCGILWTGAGLNYKVAGRSKTQSCRKETKKTYPVQTTSSNDQENRAARSCSSGIYEDICTMHLTNPV